MDLLLHNLRTIGTHHCDGTVGEEAAAEIEMLRDALALHEVGSAYAHRLAVMLECALLDRSGTWNDGHALLDEYRAACRAVAPEPPTFMGEPVLPNAPHEWPGAASSRTVPLDAVVGPLGETT